jgi:ParB family transcriptional regulator, chromosome partitioning protein
MSKKSMEDRFMEAADSASEAGETLAQQRMSGTYSLTGRDGRRFAKDIKPRPSGNTRTLDPRHILDLAESIAALGMLQPIAIDKNSKLVAGEHRLEACRLLELSTSELRNSHWEQILLQTDKTIKKSDLEEIKDRLDQLDVESYLSRYADGQIPVLMLQFDAEEDKESAFAAETAENEKRQNYTKQEVLALAERLRSAGYIERAGRPKKGEKSIKSALSVISGKSFRQIERDLAKEKTPTHVGVFDENKELAKISRLLGHFSESSPEHELSNSFINLKRKLDKFLNSEVGLEE